MTIPLIDESKSKAMVEQLTRSLEQPDNTPPTTTSLATTFAKSSYTLWNALPRIPRQILSKVSYSYSYSNCTKHILTIYFIVTVFY